MHLGSPGAPGGRAAGGWGLAAHPTRRADSGHLTHPPCRVLHTVCAEELRASQRGHRSTRIDGSHEPYMRREIGWRHTLTPRDYDNERGFTLFVVKVSRSWSRRLRRRCCVPLMLVGLCRCIRLPVRLAGRSSRRGVRAARAGCLVRLRLIRPGLVLRLHAVLGRRSAGTARLMV